MIKTIISSFVHLFFFYIYICWWKKTNFVIVLVFKGYFLFRFILIFIVKTSTNIFCHRFCWNEHCSDLWVFKNCAFAGHDFLMCNKTHQPLESENKRESIKEEALLLYTIWNIKFLKFRFTQTVLSVNFTSSAAIQSSLPQCIDPELCLGK